MKYRLCILANENPFDHELWIKAIENSDYVLSSDIVNLISDNWLEKLQMKPYDLFLLRPPGKTALFKRLYDERVSLIEQYFTTPIYPSLTEILIYENKRFFRDWLMVNQIPHPATHVFFTKSDALSFIKTKSEFPVIGKTNIGASGNGVVKLNNATEAAEYISCAFENGIRPKSGPKLTKGSLQKKLKKALSKKGFFWQRLKDYKTTPLDVQYHYVILQEFVSHTFEWRCVRIGESFFAHKKLVKGEMASGTLMKGYDPVPFTLLDFIKSVTDSHNLHSVAVDVFESKGRYLVNEIQSFFGQSDPYQMLVDGKPGRYINKSGQWAFEEGMFNTTESYDLRLKHAISQITK
jgi:glutathione synthase/RimK-type ligase-like ATP-grasp enzyme